MIKKTAALAAMGVLAVSVTGCSLFNKPKSVQTAPEYSSDTLPPVLAVGPTAVEAGKRKLCSEAELTRLFATVQAARAERERAIAEARARDARQDRNDDRRDDLGFRGHRGGDQRHGRRHQGAGRGATPAAAGTAIGCAGALG